MLLVVLVTASPMARLTQFPDPVLCRVLLIVVRLKLLWVQEWSLASPMARQTLLGVPRVLVTL